MIVLNQSKIWMLMTGFKLIGEINLQNNYNLV